MKLGQDKIRSHIRFRFGHAVIVQASSRVHCPLSTMTDHNSTVVVSMTMANLYVFSTGVTGDLSPNEQPVGLWRLPRHLLPNYHARSSTPGIRCYCESMIRKRTTIMHSGIPRNNARGLMRLLRSSLFGVLLLIKPYQTGFRSIWTIVLSIFRKGKLLSFNFPCGRGLLNKNIQRMVKNRLDRA